MNQGFPKAKNYEVMVQCCTYNQSQYIEESLKGFAIQQTNFPFVCCIFDDASIDGEQEILKRWIENHCILNAIESYDHPLSIILMAPDKDNPNCIYAIHLQKINTWGKVEKEELLSYWENQCKYIAVCEGDDYWIDPYKLQKQVDFLNENSEYGLCYTKANVYNQNLNSYDRQAIGLDFNSLEELLLENKIPTLTTVYRIDLYLQYKKEINPNTRKWQMGDYPMWLWFAANYKIKFIDEITSIYRVLENSASHPSNIKKKEQFLSSTKDIRLFFYSKYAKNKKLLSSINDIFHRECIINGEKNNNREYCLNHLNCIKNKRRNDLIKIFLYHTKIGFLFVKSITQWRL